LSAVKTDDGGGNVAMSQAGSRMLNRGISFFLGVMLSTAAFADAHQQLAYEIFRELVEADTRHSTGDTLQVANDIAARLRSEGFPENDVHVIEHGQKKGNLVARLRSKNPVGKPVLLMAHIDVVEADPADWSMDPMRLNELDGYYYGRGTLDDKDEVAIHLANLINLKREGAVLIRDVIVAFTSDEEGGPDNGAQHLVNEHRDLVDAAFVLNEGGGGVIRDGKYIANTVQTAEKVYQSYTLELTNPGGHSSLPRSDNAIYELSRALIRIQEFEFPVMRNETTRAYFSGTAASESEPAASLMLGLLADPPLQESVDAYRSQPAVNARLRTTCVATQLDAGHAENALPQRARATINCRVFPGMPVKKVKQTLAEVIQNADISITPVREALVSEASPLTDEVMQPIIDITNEMWPNATVLPTMSTGATDGLFFRNAGIPVYGVSGIFTDLEDNRKHGRDERILKQSFYEGLEFLNRLTRAYCVSTDKPIPATVL
jgi:acetylornithine deacetylase/succinyl-diaminopimelate desuccinylase-like protein